MDLVFRRRLDSLPAVICRDGAVPLAGQVDIQLVETLLLLAKDDGYSCMVLDTIEPLQSAIRLYKRFGFQETEPYYDNPMEDVIYMKKLLK